METIKTSWKPFAEWVTGSRRDLFSRARLKFTAVSIFVILILLVGSHILLAHYRNLGIRQEIERAAPGRDNLDALIMQSIGEQQKIAIKLEIIVFVALSVISYSISGIFLSPIKQILETQRRFTADAAHELRTPLSVIKTGSEVATLDDRPSVASLTKALRDNVKEIDRMSGILNNLLNISQAQVVSGKPQISFAKVNLSQLVKNMIQSVGFFARKRKIKIVFSGPEKTMIWGNQVSLEEMILNLLKNAVAYSPQGGLVRVAVTDRSPKNIELVVKDNGTGISKNDLPHIFESFYRVGGLRRSTSNGSSGLGLTIVQEIIKQHKASIKVKSALNKGTTFSVDFVSAV